MSRISSQKWKNNKCRRKQNEKSRRPPSGEPIDNGLRKQCVNMLEYRMAILLKRSDIPFEIHKKFATFDRGGNPNMREVDFWLQEPTDFMLCGGSIQAIEVKSWKFDERCLEQKEDLEQIGVDTFIVTPQYIEFWESIGFLKSKGLYNKYKSYRRLQYNSR